MPDFGRAMLAHFPLDPGGVYLNHGTVGVTPLAVMRARAAVLDEIERHPARFMIRELMSLGLTPPPEAPRLRAAAAQVAAFLGVDAPGWCSSTTRPAASTPCCARLPGSRATSC